MHKYCVIIPAYNEELNIGQTLEILKNFDVEVIVVDDGSVDKTTQVARSKCKHVLNHIVNLGKGSAMKTGAEYAFNTLNSNGIIYLDGDGQHNPKEITRFIKKLDDGHDLIFGTRKLDEKMPKIRVFGNKLLSYTTLLLFGKYIPDILSGYKAISRSGYNKIAWNAHGYDVEAEIAARTALKKLDFITIPISTVYNYMDRGMTLADAILILPKFIEWKLKL